MADDAAKQGALFDDAPGDEQVVTVSARCVLRTRGGRRVVVVVGVPAFHYEVGDRLAEAHAIVSLVGQGFATQVEAARAFGVTTRTVRRMVARFDGGGLGAPGRRGGYGLDALFEHAVEEDDAERDVPNPRWNEPSAEIRKAHAKAMRLSAHLGLDAMTNPEELRRTIRGCKIAHATETSAVVVAMERVARRGRVVHHGWRIRWR